MWASEEMVETHFRDRPCRLGCEERQRQGLSEMGIQDIMIIEPT